MYPHESLEEIGIVFVIFIKSRTKMLNCLLAVTDIHSIKTSWTCTHGGMCLRGMVEGCGPVGEDPIWVCGHQMTWTLLENPFEITWVEKFKEEEVVIIFNFFDRDAHTGCQNSDILCFIMWKWIDLSVRKLPTSRTWIVVHIMIRCSMKSGGRVSQKR
jgi:hypothetical protein